MPIIFVTLALNFNNQSMGQNLTKDREPAVAGMFYPSNPYELKNELKKLFASCTSFQPEGKVAALIVPHAGYVFSGRTAASAYAALPRNSEFQTIFIIGTSHHHHFEGASVYAGGNFKTPLGAVSTNEDIAGKLLENPYFMANPDAHLKEHTLEVQLPFLQYHLQNRFKIVPVLIGTNSEKICLKIAEALKPWFNKDNLFVISSDFSHYPSYANARISDTATGNSILANSPEIFRNTIKQMENKNIGNLLTACCSWTSILTLLNMTSSKPDIEINHVCYENSGDSPYGDKNRVVGYHSFVFSWKDENQLFGFSENEKTALLKIARQSIEDKFLNQKQALPDTANPENLDKRNGVFVTLYKNGKLRGCIGQFEASAPLFQLTGEMARASAFHDTRFNPVTPDELPEIKIEISVLSPLKKIHRIEEFQWGKHGIYIKKGNQSGTFLPKVANETGWTTEEFFGHCARDKAGIGWYGWKDAELYVYETEVFKEK